MHVWTTHVYKITTHFVEGSFQLHLYSFKVLDKSFFERMETTYQVTWWHILESQNHDKLVSMVGGNISFRYSVQQPL